MHGHRQFLQIGTLSFSAFTIKSCISDDKIRKPIVLSTGPEHHLFWMDEFF